MVDLEQAHTSFSAGLYHSAARDYANYLWHTNAQDPCLPDTRHHLLECGRLLDRQGFPDSARNVYRTIIKTCPNTPESHDAESILSAPRKNRWMKAWQFLTAGLGHHGTPHYTH
jgi:hypothetical protein